MSTTMNQLNEAKGFIMDKLGGRKLDASIAIVLGSGLSHFAEVLKKSAQAVTIPFSEIPHFCSSTVEGHKGELIFGNVDNEIPVIAMSGRLHFYEGFQPCQVIFPVRVLSRLGISSLILTNAAGAIGDDFEPGQLMVLNDHINLTGHNPLVGENLAELGPRFVDLTEAYDKKLIAIAKDAAHRADIMMHEGVYAALVGPCYETPAEIRMLKLLGAHAVGMSTVFETIAARHLGISVLAISCLTNKAAGLSKNKISHEEVIENNAKVASKLELTLNNIVRAMGRLPRG